MKDFQKRGGEGREQEIEAWLDRQLATGGLPERRARARTSRCS